MCSVVGCDSGRRGAQRFKLPEDPERRLEWVQFLAAVNKQRFRESSWTDFTVCSEHFKDDCFQNVTPSRSDRTDKVQLTLKPHAVPSLCTPSQSHQPDSTKCVEPVKTTEVADSRGVSSDTSDVFISVYGQMHPRNVNSDLIREKAALLQTKGKYVVNEKRLLQLFSCKCPSCGGKLKMEKITHGVLITFNQQCLECEYRNQWRSQVNANVPTSEDQQGSPPTQQAAPKDEGSITGVPEIITVIGEDSNPINETEKSSDQGDMDSDEDWKPVQDILLARVLQKKQPVTEDEEDEEDDDCAPRHNLLCTDCGKFTRWKSHMCEHKIKPYSCNICGRRCVSEVALNSHSRIHNENYEYRCKFCHATFKTKVDKQTHEQTHITEGSPYKCPDCSETFATNKERKIHLEDHRGPRQLKCHICGREFRSPPYLQRHLAVHTGEKQFKCSVCQRAFNQAGHLKSHVRLHTGERPFKCQHCDKCFNHNVSLKSHIQRYHTSNSGCEQTKEKINEKERDTGDGEGKGDPTRRPTSYESGNLVLAVQVEGQGSKSTMRKPKEQTFKNTQCSDEESEGKLSNSDTTYDSAEEEEERSKSAAKNTARSRGEPRNSDNDSDFDPGERKKKRYSSQNGGKSSGKRRGRRRKNLVV